MKLFSPPENDAKKQSEVARDVARIEILREEIVKAQKELGETKAKFDLTMAEQRQFWAKEEQEHLVKIDKLSKEVKVLEERQRVSLFPIAAAERKAYDYLEKSKQTLLDSQLQKEKNEELEELLQDKIDSLTDRETDVTHREEKAKVNEANLDYQRLQVKALTEDLSKKWSEFYAASTDKDREFGEHNRLIEIHRKDLDRREDMLLEAQLILKDEQLKVQSDRQTLKAAFQELQKHGK
jgi:hypothetical protein